MDGLNRAKKEITIAPYFDEDGLEVIARRTFQYDTLVLAIGSTTNDFGVKGALENSMALDTQEQAERFHRQLTQCISARADAASPIASWAARSCYCWCRCNRR